MILLFFCTQFANVNAHGTYLCGVKLIRQKKIINV